MIEADGLTLSLPRLSFGSAHGREVTIDVKENREFGAYLYIDCEKKAEEGESISRDVETAHERNRPSRGDLGRYLECPFRG